MYDPWGNKKTIFPTYTLLLVINIVAFQPFNIVNLLHFYVFLKLDNMQ